VFHCVSTALGTSQSLISVDALQEFRFKVPATRRFGRSPGGQFSLETPVGTNQLHGSAYDYLRNDAFDANDWVQQRLRRQNLRSANEFRRYLGWTGSNSRLYNGTGRSFFFASYEGLRLTQPQARQLLMSPMSICGINLRSLKRS